MGLTAILRLTWVGLLPRKRDGEAEMAMGRDTTRTINARARNVHRGPMLERSARTSGENTRPPIPAPERMKPTEKFDTLSNSKVHGIETEGSTYLQLLCAR